MDESLSNTRLCMTNTDPLFALCPSKFADFDISTSKRLTNFSELAFNTPRAFEDIYGHRVGRVNMNKDPIHVGAVEAIPGATNLTMADEADHPRQRRALAHAFSQKALMEQEHILQGYVDKFVDKLRELSHSNKPANMVSWFNFCTFDIIGDLSFGEPFGCLEEGKQDQNNRSMDTYLHWQN
jgi:cytochrome P450